MDTIFKLTFHSKRFDFQLEKENPSFYLYVRLWRWDYERMPA